jgi:uncharacterized protein
MSQLTRPAPSPTTEADIKQLQSLLDRIPSPLEPLDVSMMDGYLCSVLIQPRKIDLKEYLPFILDIEGQPAPNDFPFERTAALVEKRHHELQQAIQSRSWFDPWVFELEDDDLPQRAGLCAEQIKARFCVYPWVAGFVSGLACFPELLESSREEEAAQQLNEALALLYQYLDPEDLEDADDILEEIAALEPAVDLGECVESLVQATLLLMDLSQPHPAPLTRLRTAPPPKKQVNNKWVSKKR